MLSKEEFEALGEREKVEKLLESCSEGKKEQVEGILEFGMRLDCEDEYYHNPLIVCAQYQHLDLLSFLVSKGASVNALNTEMKSPLSAAAEQGGDLAIKKTHRTWS